MGIETNYERFYIERSSARVYPTEFVVRTFLAEYPSLSFRKPQSGAKVLDIACGDGRNTAFLCERGYEVSAIEITQGIVDATRERMVALGHKVELRVGRNTSIPFPDSFFDCILACHCCYYCDEGETFSDNLREYARVLKTGGSLVASVADRESYIFQNAEDLSDGSLLIRADPYDNRNGYRLHAFSSATALIDYMSVFFENFSVGSSRSNYFGIEERVFWVVCEKI